MTKKINRIFIANRGEIARRIAISANRLGIETVAIADTKVPPLYLSSVVSEFAEISEEQRQGVFLNQSALISLAKQHSCDAIHPGFGFLSEDATFAKAVDEAGIIWIGPQSESIAKMGSKAEASDIAEKAGVPCLPALRGIDPSNNEDLKRLDEFVEKVGLPVLIKASLGGGGKGMRLVDDISTLHENALRAHSEATSSFGSGSLIVEPYLNAPRHVEVQVLGDQHGNVLCIGDRDCSLQRRHQKIIEEAPAPQLTDATRKAMHNAALELARGVAYESAGTVEFLVDWAPHKQGQDLQSFYFLEMNTRLQVEHPVTEEVHGLDLVAWQLRVAEGQSLEGYDFATPRGHSIEVRLYAEDPWNEYLPQVGPVHWFKPAHGGGVRWELGLDQIGEISPDFDPMFAKLVVQGETREIALAQIARCLEETTFVGPRTNIELLWWLTAESSFRESPKDTGYLKETLNIAKQRLADLRSEAQSAFGSLLSQAEGGRSSRPLASKIDELSASIFGKRPTHSTTKAKLENCTEVFFESAETQGRRTESSHLLINKNNKIHNISVGKASGPKHSLKWIKTGIITLEEDLSSSSSLSLREGSGVAGATEAPVPGKVIAIKVKDGDSIEEGTTVVILESMKMEFEVKSSKTGTIKNILVGIGDQINAGAPIIEWQAE